MSMLPVAILAGGLATRLKGLAETCPKSLVSVAGKPFLHHQLAILRRQGIQNVVICTGHLGDQIVESVRDGSEFGLSVRYSPDGSEPLGTGGAIAKAIPLLGREFFVMYGDSFLLCNFTDVHEAFRSQCCSALMTLYENANQFDRSNVLFQDNRILQYTKEDIAPDMAHIDYGLGVFSAELFAEFEGSFDLAVVYQRALACGQLGSFVVPQRFYEIGSHRGLMETQRLLKLMGDPR